MLMTCPSPTTHAPLPDNVKQQQQQQETSADLNQHIKDLQCQLTATHKRHEHVEHELANMRTAHVALWHLSHKQSALIDALESKLNQAADMRRDMKQLEMERHDMDNTLQVVRDVALKQERDTARTLEAIAVLQQQQGNAQTTTTTTSSNERSFSSSSLDQQRTRALESRVKQLDSYIDTMQRHQDQQETEKWRHTAQLQAAKIDALEKRISSLKDQLVAHQTALRQGDTSGTIARLQDQNQQLQHEKRAVEEDFESSYEAVVKENDALTQLANQQSYQIQQLQTALAESHQQLSEQQSIKQAYDALNKEYQSLEKMNQELVAVNTQIQHTSLVSSSSRSSSSRSNSNYHKRTTHRLSIENKPQLMSWVQEKLETSCTMDVLQKVSHLADENKQLAHWVDDLERQLMSQRHHLSQQVKTLECNVMNLTVLNTQLERQIETPPAAAARFSRSSSSSAATTHAASTHRLLLLRRRDETPRCDDDSSIKHRSTTPNVPPPPPPPPPTDPPNQPLPPTPPVSEQFDTPQQLGSYRTLLEMAETQVKAHQKRASDMETSQQEMQKELDLERRQRQKAEQAHAILEKRLQDVMMMSSHHKKNKFLCF